MLKYLRLVGSIYHNRPSIKKKKIVDALQLHWISQLGVQFGSRDALLRGKNLRGKWDAHT